MVMIFEIFRVLNVKVRVLLGVIFVLLGKRMRHHLVHVFCTMCHHILKDCDLKEWVFCN